MLDLERPLGPFHGVMCYRDHLDNDLIHYVPERPRLSTNEGVREFVFLSYRHDITDNPSLDAETKDKLGGGLLAFTVDLSLEEEVLKQVKREVARFTDGDVKLSPMQFRDGTVRLAMTDPAKEGEGAPSGSLIERSFGATKPDIMGSHRATFAVTLDHENSLLLEAGLQSGICPMGIIYDLEGLGLAPAFNVKITADYKRIYEHLELQFGVKAQIQMVSIGADVDLAWQKLRDEGAIKVEVLNFSDDESLRKQADAAFDFFKTELLKDFFKTALEPPSFMKPNSGNTGLLGQLQGLFGQLGATQSGSSTPQRGAATQEAPTSSPPPASIGDGQTTTTEANRSAQGNAQGGTPAANGGGANGAGGGSGFGPIQLAFSLKFYRQEELKTRTFEYSMRQAVERHACPQGLFSTLVEGLDLSRAIKRVDLDSDFFRRLLTHVSMGADLARNGITSVAVNLEYPGTPKPGEQPITLGGFEYRPGDQPRVDEVQTWLNERKDIDYRYRMDVHFDPQSEWQGAEPHVASDWIVTRGPQLTLNPFDIVDTLLVDVTLGDLEADRVEQVQVDLGYDDGGGFDIKKTVALKPGGQSSIQWKLRPREGAPRTFDYRLTYFLPGNVRHVADWVTTDNPSLTINDPFQGAIGVRLFPVLSADEVIEATVDLDYEEPGTGYRRSVRERFESAEEMAQGRDVVIPTLAGDPVEFTYEVSILRADGSIHAPGPVTVPGETKAVVVSDGVGSTHRVRLQLANTDLGSSDLAAIRVTLGVDGVADDDGDSAEVLFTSSQTDEQALTLVTPNGTGRKFSYAYETVGYDLDGIPISGSSGRSSAAKLIVQTPRR
jgi:hypothetical protein